MTLVGTYTSEPLTKNAISILNLNVPIDGNRANLSKCKPNENIQVQSYIIFNNLVSSINIIMTLIRHRTVFNTNLFLKNLFRSIEYISVV